MAQKMDDFFVRDVIRVEERNVKEREPYAVYSGRSYGKVSKKKECAFFAIFII